MLVWVVAMVVVRFDVGVCSCPCPCVCDFFFFCVLGVSWVAWKLAVYKSLEVGFCGSLLTLSSLQKDILSKTPMFNSMFADSKMKNKDAMAFFLFCEM